MNTLDSTSLSNANRRQPKRTPNRWTPEDDDRLRHTYSLPSKPALEQLATTLGRSRNAIKQRASRLGCSTPRKTRHWTPEEERFLLHHSGTLRLPLLAKRLKRSCASIAKKCQALQLRTRHHEGYTLHDLTICFGTSEHTIREWVRQGKLHVDYRGTSRTNDAWAVTDDALLRFIEHHPMAFRLQSVDQLWFLDLLFDNRIIQRAITALAPTAS